MIIWIVLIGGLLAVWISKLLDTKRIDMRIDREMSYRQKAMYDQSGINLNVQTSLNNMDKGVRKLAERVGQIEAKGLSSLVASPVVLVTCEKCGCAVLREDALQGSSEIIDGATDLDRVTGIRREKIRERFYCKEHAPKKK